MAIPKNINTITLVDVAREAGVSLKTASRALNDEPYVKEKTAARIREVMARLDYRPNELARGLKARKSIAIGMIVPNLSDPFTGSAVKAVQEIARANGHIVILASSGGYSDVERFEVQSLIGRQIDGLVISPADSRKNTVSDIIPPGLHVVTYDQPIHGADFDSVTIPNRRSAKSAVKHLLDHGYKRVVAIGARPALYTCSERMAGYREAMKKAGLEPRACMVEHENLLTPEWLSETVFRQNKADAIICMNWVCTMLTLRAMREIDKRLGSDVPFLSFDDFELADMLTPSLTVVRQPAEAFGAEAATLLFERIRGTAGEARRSVVLATELILRQSCGCAPVWKSKTKGKPGLHAT
ncbi:MAG: LacI family transcriptional regulator [Acidobacteriota bacterium]|nr:LacI family transcriptional regulator [Acidobacteriota bacterium]